MRAKRDAESADRRADREARRTAAKGPPAFERGAVVTDASLVDHGAQMVAQIKRQHRGIVERSRSLAETLLAELAAVTNAPEMFAQVHMLLADGEEVSATVLRRMAEAVESLPSRARTLAVLVDAVRSLIGAEREAYGMTAQDGTGRPLAVVKDYTGKDDHDAPPQQEDDGDALGLG